MKIKNILSIGSGCDSMFLLNILNLRYKGPVDNIGSLIGFPAIKELFDKTFYNNVLNKNYIFNDYNNINQNPFGFKFGNWHCIHNDLHQQKYYDILVNRLNNFYEYLDEAKNNKQLFFMYCVFWNDVCYYDEKTYNECLNYLPKFVKDRLLILDAGHLPEFKLGNYPIYRGTTNKELSDPYSDKIKIINDFNNWWSKNKQFYEELNNCKYDLI